MGQAGLVALAAAAQCRTVVFCKAVCVDHVVAGCKLVKQVVGWADCYNLSGDAAPGFAKMVDCCAPRIGKHILLLYHFGQKQLDCMIELFGGLCQPGKADKQLVAQPTSNQAQLVDQLVGLHVGRQLGCAVVAEQADVVSAGVED